MSTGPITKNGIHPISQVRAVAAAKPAAAATVKAAPATKVEVKPATPAPATKETGLGSKFYPKQLGLRGK